MEMYQIRYFLSVCDTMSFTRASEKCFVSQPSLTKAIQKLEDALGGRLLDRNNNGIQLTELGQMMQPNLEQLYVSAAQAKEQAKRFLESNTERLRIGIMCSISLEPVIPVLMLYQEQYPEVELVFDEGTLEELTDALDKDEIDLALMATPHALPKRFEPLPLFTEAYVIACSRSHPFAKRPNIALKDLDQQSYINRINCEYSDHIGSILEEASIELKVCHETAREDWAITMIKNNIGVCFLPENISVNADIPYTKLAEHDIARKVVACTLAQKEQPVALKRFLALLQSYHWSSAGAGLESAA